MPQDDVVIRVATVDDCEALRAIYAPYVTGTAITFEYDVPSACEFASRVASTLERYPYLVAEGSRGIVGYAYASEFKDRAAYDWAVETTVYLAQDARGKGVGRRLYEALERALRAQGILNMNACIAYPAEEDEHLTRGSVGFHEAMGFEMVGRFHACGYKFGHWYDMVWMEKLIADHGTDQPDVRPFGTLGWIAS